MAVVDDLSRGRRRNVPGDAAFYELDACSVCRIRLAGCLFYAKNAPRAMQEIARKPA